MAALSTRLEIRSLPSERAAEAYPTVRSVLPELSLEDWVGYVADVNGNQESQASGAGILAAETEQGYIHGLLCYRVERDPLHGRCLEVDPFIAFEIGRRPDVAACLLGALDGLAKRYGCGAIHVTLPRGWAAGPAPQSELIRVFEAHGHAITRIGLCKFLDTDEKAHHVNPPADVP